MADTASKPVRIAACPCCSSVDWKPHAYTKMMSYLECLRCHYYVQVDEGSADKSIRFSQEQEKFYDQGSLCLSSGFAMVNADIAQRRVSIIRQYLPPGASLVEVGPGAGDLVIALADLGFAATAVEHSSALAARLADRRGITVMVGEFEDQGLPEAHYDAYCSFHVIEHVVDFRRHLRLARDCVKPGGYAFVATPNSRGWEHRLPLGLSPNYDSSHFQLFSAAALERVMRESGWEVTSIVTPSYPIAWLRVLTKLLRRLRAQDENTTGGHYARSASKRLSAAISVFSVLTSPLRAIQESLSGGNELLVIARRAHSA